jgi:SAM-dependent methyltransferase
MLNISKHWKSLRTWWGSPLGQAFLESEEGYVKQMLSQLFGYHLLVLGEPVFLRCVKDSPITHRVVIHPYTSTSLSQTSSTLTSRHDKLPIIAEGVDLIYLAHSLAFIKNPHEVLREVFRVLIAEGHVIISNFNPWSLWGLWRWLVHYIRRVPWDGHFVSLTRLKDWLALLGFDVLEVRRYFFRPPISHPILLQRLSWLETCGRWCWPFFGGGYVLLARKRVMTLTPIRPSFEIQPKILASIGIEPAPSERVQNNQTYLNVFFLS